MSYRAAQAVGRISLGGTRGGVPRFEINENSTLELCKELQMGLKNNDILPKVIRDEMLVVLAKSFLLVYMYIRYLIFFFLLFINILSHYC